MGVILSAPAEFCLEDGLEHRDGLSVDVVNHRRRENQG